MSQTKLLTQLIKSLEDPEFDELARIYLAEVDGVSNVINCNGPYDSGIDMRAVDISKMEMQYQITTKEKKFETKLEHDLKKAAENVRDFALPNKVKYFYSYPLSNTAVLKYKKEYKNKHNIILDLVEANTIAEVALQYEGIVEFLYNTAALDKYKGGSDFFSDSRVKTFYDLMSFGTSTDIKYNIIKSFVLNFLYTNKSVTFIELLKKVNQHFSSQIVEAYFDGFCKRMSSERKLHLVKQSNPLLVELTEVERTRLQNVLEKYSVEEALLKKEIHDILKGWNLEKLTDEVIVQLSDLYESNYAVNLAEFTKRNSSVTNLRSATVAFNSYIKSKLNNPADSETLTKKLIETADENEILSRIAAGQVYSKVSDPERLQEYVTRHNNNKDIFLDTNVVLRALCVHYAPDANYDDYHFKVAKQFLEFARNNLLNLKVLRPYTIEIVNVFKEALAIIPFAKLPLFEKLGGSKNILYGFYLNLKDTEYFGESNTSFEDFLKEFRFQQRNDTHSYHYIPQISFLLNSLGMEIKSYPEYDLYNARNIINEDLRATSKKKSAFAITNDAIMLMRLGDEDVDINPIDPIFCTWDLSLSRVRKKFFDIYPGCTQWLMYTPTRLMDHYSMMNFQVKKGTLSNEVLSILDEDFSFQERTQSLLDTMLIVINPKNEIGLKYTNKLAELRQQEIIQVDRKSSPITEDSAESKPIDIVFHKLFVNYATQQEEGVLESFKAIFTKQEYFDDMVKILSKEVQYVTSNGMVSDNLFSDVDIIITKIKQPKEETLP